MEVFYYTYAVWEGFALYKAGGGFIKVFYYFVSHALGKVVYINNLTKNNLWIQSNPHQYPSTTIHSPQKNTTQHHLQKLKKK